MWRGRLYSRDGGRSVTHGWALCKRAPNSTCWCNTSSFSTRSLETAPSKPIGRRWSARTGRNAQSRGHRKEESILHSSARCCWNSRITSWVAASCRIGPSRCSAGGTRFGRWRRIERIIATQFTRGGIPRGGLWRLFFQGLRLCDM